LPGLAAVVGRWRALTGADFDLVTPLLSVDAELAGTYPAPDRSGICYEVVEHGPDDFVAVTEDGTTIPLTRADLVVQRLNTGQLVRAVAGVFGIEPDGSAVEGPGRTLRVGLYRPVAGFEFPVYLTIQLEERDYRAVLTSLAAQSPGPFLLLAPTTRHHRMVSKHFLDQQNCAFLALADAIRSGESGRWEATEAAGAWLAEFRSRVLPAADTGGRVFFPTPAGAKWSDVRLRFEDGETVAVKVGAVDRRLTYAQMGMADGRNAKPTKQWQLLRDLAGGGGLMTWKTPGAERKNQKRIEILAKDLIGFFRIPGDPIPITADRKGWRTAFVLERD
jgi:hypothetical protein